MSNFKQPTSLAPTGDQEVAGSPGPGNILLWKLIMKYFLPSIFYSLPSADSKRAVVSFCELVLVSYLED